MFFDIKQSEELLTSHSGIALTGALLEKTNLTERLNAVFLPSNPRPEILHDQVVKSMIGLLSLSKPDYEAIKFFRKDSFFQHALGIKKIPSEATIRQRLDAVNYAFDSILKEESALMIKRHAPGLTSCHQNYVPLDADVSPFDNSGTKKEGVSWTYKKMDGYSPMFAYLGEEGYLINAELREGKQHCQKGTPAFLKETFQLAKQVTSSPILLRLDSGNDSVENLKVCIEEKIDWLIKRNPRHESKEEWLQIAKYGQDAETPRPGKTIYYGDIEVSKNEIEDRLFRQVFKITVREIDRKGQAFLFPDIDLEIYDTSLSADPRTIVELYHAHGTSEQFHSELKTDMDLERLPSGKFATNALVLLLGLVAYNCLRLIGQESLREEGAPRKAVSRRRLRSVIQDLIYIASRIVYHARRWGLSFGRCNPWYLTWKRIYKRFKTVPNDLIKDAA